MAGGEVGNVRVAGIACAVPEAVRTRERDAEVFGAREIERIAKHTGVSQRHVSPPGMCASDLCFAAAEKLLEEMDWDRRSVEVLVFVSVTPDYVTPATACLLQDRLKLDKGCAAFDVTHACSGYVYGLWTVSHLLRRGTMKRALLLVGDTASRMASPRDRSVATLFGDAGSATALEWSEGAAPMFFEMGSDGGGAEHLIVKAGGFRHPASEETAKSLPREGGNFRSDEDLYMNGTEIFAFTLREVPSLGKKVLARAGWTLDGVDAVVMHQANLFIIQYLSKAMKIPKEKIVEDLGEYGNTSAASIPLALSGKLSARLRAGPERLLLLGFGTGLSWGGVALSCGGLSIPELTKLGGEELVSRRS